MYNRSLSLYWRRILQPFLILGTLLLWSSATYAAPPVQNPVPTPTPLSENAKAARAHYKTAFPLYQNKKYDEAIEEFWKVIQLEPTYDVAYRWMAQAYIDKGDPDGAIKRFESLLQADSKNGLAYYGLSKVYREGKKDTDKAIEYANKSTELTPDLPWGYYVLGVIYENDLNEHQKAIGMYKKAMGVDPGFLLATPRLIGMFKKEDETWEQTTLKSEQAVATDPHGEYADIYQHMIGMGYNSQGNFSKAIEELRKLINVYPNSVLVPNALAGIAVVQSQLGNYESSLDIFSEIQKNYPNGSFAVIATMLKGLVYAQQGKYEEAAADLKIIVEDYPYFGETWNTNDGQITQQGLEKLLHSMIDQSVQGETKGLEAEELCRHFNSDEGIKKGHEALNIATRTGNKRIQAEVDMTLGNCFNRIGQYEDALKYYFSALELFRQEDEKKGEMGTSYSIALAYVNVQDFEKAKLFAEEGEGLSSEAGTSREKGMLQNSLAGIYYYLGDYQAAIEHAVQAADFLRNSWEPESRSDEAGVYATLATILIEVGRYPEAFENYEKEAAAYKKLGIVNHEAKAYRNIAQLHMKLGNQKETLESLQKAIELIQGSVDHLENARIEEELGNYYIKFFNDSNDALDHYEKALKLYDEHKNPSGEATVYSEISQVYKRDGNQSKAIESISKMLEALERARSDFTIEEIKSSYSSGTSNLYELAALDLFSFAQLENGIAKRNLLEQAFNAVEHSRARTFLDQIGHQRTKINRIPDPKIAEQEQRLRSEIGALDTQLQTETGKAPNQQNAEVIKNIRVRLERDRRDYESLFTILKLQNPEYASLVTANPFTLPEIQTLIEAQSSLVEYFVTEEQIIVFVITRDDFQVIGVQIPRADLNKEIQTFRDFSNLQNAQPDSLSKLYNWLIAPVTSQLKTKNLIIVPHGVLHYLPFQALTDGTHYLAEDYTISYAPSASVLKFALEKRKDKADTLIAFGEPKVQGLPALRYAGQESQSVADLYNAQPILGVAATKSKLEAVAGNYSILHIAAHGEYNPISPLFSSLRLTPEGSDDGRLTVQDVYGLDLAQADLVVLSACETQLGPVTRGDEIVGLSRAFIYAGTPTIIASLWNVDDEATNVLMTSFYTHLKQGMSKAEALRAAQLETRAKYPNPYYWAGFVLTGDPGKSNVVAPPPQPQITTPPQSEPAQQTYLYWILLGAAAVLVGLGSFVIWRIRRQHRIKV